MPWNYSTATCFDITSIKTSWCEENYTWCQSDGDGLKGHDVFLE